MSLAQLNNLVSQDREVLELADGSYILVSKHTKIFKMKELRRTYFLDTPQSF